jgi:hypothetical protein
MLLILITFGQNLIQYSIFVDFSHFLQKYNNFEQKNLVLFIWPTVKDAIDVAKNFFIIFSSIFFNDSHEWPYIQ